MGNERQNNLIETWRDFMSFGLSHTFIVNRNDLPSLGDRAFNTIASESYSWSFSNDFQTRNCDGVVFNILMDHMLQWPQEGLNCEPLTCSAVS